MIALVIEMNIKKLKEAREKKYSTQAKFAEALGVPQGTVGRWESGIREPKKAMRARIAELLEVSQSYLFEEETEVYARAPQNAYRFRLAPYVELLDLVRDTVANMDESQRETAGNYLFKAAIVLGGPKILTMDNDGRPSIPVGVKVRTIEGESEIDPGYKFDITPFRNILDTAFEDSKVASPENIDEAVDTLKKIMRELAY